MSARIRLATFVVDGAVQLRQQLFEACAAGAGLLAGVVVAVVDAFEVANARIVAGVAPIERAVLRAQQLLVLEALLVAGDLVRVASASSQMLA